MANELSTLTRQMVKLQRQLAQKEKSLNNANIISSVKIQNQKDIIILRDQIDEFEKKIELFGKLYESKQDLHINIDIVNVGINDINSSSLVNANTNNSNNNNLSQLNLDNVIRQGIEVSLLDELSISDERELVHLTNKLIKKLESKNCILDFDMSKSTIKLMIESNFAEVRACALRILRYSINYSLLDIYDDREDDDEEDEEKEESDMEESADKSDTVHRSILIMFEHGFIRCLKDPTSVDYNEMINLVNDLMENGHLNQIPELVLINLRKSFQAIISGGNMERMIEITEICLEICLLYPDIGHNMRFLNIVLHTLLEPPYHSNSNVNNDIKLMSLPLILKYLNDDELRNLLYEQRFFEMLISNLIDCNLNPVFQHNHTLLNKRMFHLGVIFGKLMDDNNVVDILIDRGYLQMLIDGLYTDSSVIKNSVMGVLASGLKIRKLVNGWGTDQFDEILPWEKLANKKPMDERIRSQYNGRACPDIEDADTLRRMTRLLQGCIDCGVADILMQVHQRLGPGDKKLGKRIVLFLSEMMYLKGKLLRSARMVQVEFQMNNLIEREIKKHIRLEQQQQQQQQQSRLQPLLEPYVLNPSLLQSLGVDISCCAAAGGDTLTTLCDPATLARHLRICADTHFDYKALVLSSHVTASREYSEWEWPIVELLVEIVLWNAHAFEDTIRTTKFFKRVTAAVLAGQRGSLRLCHTLGTLLGRLADPGAGPGAAAGVGAADHQGLLRSSPWMAHALAQAVLSKRGMAFAAGLSQHVRGVSLLEQAGTVAELYGLACGDPVVGVAVQLLSIQTSGQIRVLFERWHATGSAALRQAVADRVRAVDTAADYTLRHWVRSLGLGSRQPQRGLFPTER